MVQTVSVSLMRGKSERIDREFKKQNPTLRCNTDCANDPHNCISERLFRQMADLIVSDGYQDVGYSYINVDDCWLAHTRDRQGRLQVIYSQFFFTLSINKRYPSIFKDQCEVFCPSMKLSLSKSTSMVKWRKF